MRRVERVQHRLQSVSIAIPGCPMPLTFTYSSQTSVKNCRIPSSFFPSCRSTNFMSAHPSESSIVTMYTAFLTAWSDECRNSPFIEFIHRFQVPAPSSTQLTSFHITTYIVFSFLITSSIISRLAFAIIWMTWRSCPPPRRTPPAVCCVVLDAPESAVSVPANAEVDQFGRFADNGDVMLGAGLVE